MSLPFGGRIPYSGRMKSTSDETPPFSRPWKIANALVALAYIFLMANVPLVFIPGAPLDDALFVKGGGYIASGHWLGPYSNFTLAKGPVYPLFVALNWVIGLPILVAQAIVYAGATFCLVRGLRPWLRAEALTLGVYVLLLLNPATYAVANLRVMREGLYVSLTLLLFGLALHWCHRRGRAWRDRVVLAVWFGIAFGLFWCLREEGLWIMPTLLLGIAALALAELARHGGPLQQRFRQARAALLRDSKLAGVAAAGAIGIWCAFATANYAVYGVFDVVEVKQREFVAAYGALARIRVEETPANVVVPRLARQKAYAVSAAAAELAPVLDGEIASIMAGPGCAYYHVEPCDNELRSAWFIWALRDAAFLAGHYRSAPEARAFYGRIAAEINAACDAGKLECRPPRATLAPVFTPAQIPATVAAAWKLSWYLLDLEGLMVPEHPMSCVTDDCGGGLAWAQFLDMVHTDVFVLVEDPPPTVTRRSPTADPNKFNLDQYMQMERAERPMPFVYRAAVVAKVLKRVAAAYRAALPVMVGAASLAWLVLAGVAIVRRRVAPLFVVATVAAIAVKSRIALLAYLDATSVPSINPLYLSPAYPLLLLFCVTAIAGAVLVLRTR